MVRTHRRLVFPSTSEVECLTVHPFLSVYLFRSAIYLWTENYRRKLEDNCKEETQCVAVVFVFDVVVVVVFAVGFGPLFFLASAGAEDNGRLIR